MKLQKEIKEKSRKSNLQKLMADNFMRVMVFQIPIIEVRC